MIDDDLSVTFSSASVDPVEMARELIRCRSVTPVDDGCLEKVRRILQAMGFSVDLFRSGEGDAAVTNLIGRHGNGGPVLAFAGHTDVVPAGDEREWSHPPFAAALADGHLWGRGAVDMKGALGAFLAATHSHLRRRSGAPGTLLILLTGDEEVGDENGMRAIIARMHGKLPVPEACLIGEPSCEGHFGQGVRIGRRGSLNVRVTARGVAGHVAWPHRARNALHLLMDYLSEVRGQDLEGPEACFPGTNLEVTSIDSDSEVSNVIPGKASARLNIRFNRRHQGRGLVAKLEAIADRYAPSIHLAPSISGEPYLAENSVLPGLVVDEVTRSLGQPPESNAGGGVSDGRFLRNLCPVVEFGLVGDSAHKVDERAAIEDIRRLTTIYSGVLDRFFGAAKTGVPASGDARS